MTNDVVTAAGAKVAELIDGVKAAEKAVDTAQGALADARAKLECAGADDDAVALVEGVWNAQKAVDLALARQRITAAQYRRAVDAHADAVHHSHDEAHAAARAERLAACVAMDEALTAHAQAAQRFAAATAKIRAMHQTGRKRPFEDGLLGNPHGDGFGAMPTFQAADAERALWEGTR